jgi:alpha-L-rhamnosidase
VGVSPVDRESLSGAADIWSGAQWIGDGRPQPTNDAAFYADDPAPLFRKRFVVAKTVRSATLSIVGLGFYEASLNGETLNWGLLPPWTPYGNACSTTLMT